MSSPAVDLPPGSDDTRAPGIIASATIFWVFAASLVALRFYVRTRISHVFGAEDWTLLASLICSLGNSICLGMLTAFGYGKHIWTLTPDDYVSQGKVAFAMQVCYMVSLALTKISILVLYLRILTYHHARWIIWTVLILTIVYNIVGFAIQMTACIPLQKLWGEANYGTCHPLALIWAFVGLHISTDFIVFAIPIPIVTRLTMPLQQKLLLIGLFGIGFFACIVSLIRALQIKMIFTSADHTWESIPTSHWNCVEVNIAIVCACLMTMKPLISKIWPGFLASSLNEVHVTVEKESATPSDEVSCEPRTMDSKLSESRPQSVDIEAQR